MTALGLRYNNIFKNTAKNHYGSRTTQPYRQSFKRFKRAPTLASGVSLTLRPKAKN